MEGGAQAAHRRAGARDGPSSAWRSRVGADALCPFGGPETLLALRVTTPGGKTAAAVVATGVAAAPTAAIVGVATASGSRPPAGRFGGNDPPPP
jgi:hypothetical protein